MKRFIFVFFFTFSTIFTFWACNTEDPWSPYESETTLSNTTIGWDEQTITLTTSGDIVQSVDLAGNDGTTGNPLYVSLAFAETYHNSVKLDGLTSSSTVECGTNASFALDTHSGSKLDIAPRAVICGVHFK